MQILSDNEEQNILSMLNVAKHEISELSTMESQFNSLLDMLEEASIQISEVSDELRHYSDRLEMDPNRLFELENVFPNILVYLVNIVSSLKSYMNCINN